MFKHACNLVPRSALERICLYSDFLQFIVTQPTFFFNLAENGLINFSVTVSHGIVFFYLAENGHIKKTFFFLYGRLLRIPNFLYDPVSSGARYE